MHSDLLFVYINWCTASAIVAHVLLGTGCMHFAVPLRVRNVTIILLSNYCCVVVYVFILGFV